MITGGMVQRGLAYSVVVTAWGALAMAGGQAPGRATQSPGPGLRQAATTPAIAAGSSYSLKLSGDGTVWTWGTGSVGGMGAFNPGVPVQVSGLSGVVAIAAGAGHSLALKTDGTVWAWGTIAQASWATEPRDSRPPRRCR